MAKDRCEECKGKEKLRKVKIGTDAKGSYEIITLCEYCIENLKRHI